MSKHKKLRPIKWFRIVEFGDEPCDNNYQVYCMSVIQPYKDWRPVNSKFDRQKSRFLKFKIAQ